MVGSVFVNGLHYYRKCGATNYLQLLALLEYNSTIKNNLTDRHLIELERTVERLNKLSKEVI
jgi:hypothetical protein